MQTNFLELRKEAYRLWGIANHEIVYDYPQSPHYNKNGFYFKLDFSKENASWPRTYAVGRKVEHDEQVYRIIVPIIVYKKFNTFSLKTKAWYDMPKYVHDQIVEITKESRIEKKMPWGKRVWNKLSPQRLKVREEKTIEEFLYIASRLNNEIIITAS